VLASPESDDDFRDYVLGLLEEDTESEETDTPGLCAGLGSVAPQITARAKTLAEEWVLMAKSETLKKLGEQRGAEDLADRIMREYAGWGS
jgi:hypothetical protein